MARLKWVGLASLLIVGCAPRNPGSHPHDMSATEHEAEAVRRDAAATEHAAQYDPAASITTVDCARLGGLTTGHYNGPCWTVVTNPTQEHLAAAEQQRSMAAEHRAASAELREVEATACAGISDDDRDVSPFLHLTDISGVEALVDARPDVKTGSTISPSRETADSAQATTWTRGAVVTFRAVPGLTAEYLQRTVDCHLARNAVLGHVVPEMPDCPLVPRGAVATVSSTGTGFAVAIGSDDAEAAADILARARRLVDAAPLINP